MANPALRDLEVLVGTWRVELTNASFVDAGAALTGTLDVSWLDDAFLVLRSSFDGDGPPTSVSVIGRNESLDSYEVLYSDDRGVSRIYVMTFDDGDWIQHREDPGFHQRFEGSVDGDGIRAEWTRSHDDGVTWVHDFDLVYRRV